MYRVMESRLPVLERSIASSVSLFRMFLFQSSHLPHRLSLVSRLQLCLSVYGLFFFVFCCLGFLQSILLSTFSMIRCLVEMSWMLKYSHSPIFHLSHFMRLPWLKYPYTIYLGSELVFYAKCGGCLFDYLYIYVQSLPI